MCCAALYCVVLRRAVSCCLEFARPAHRTTEQPTTFTVQVPTAQRKRDSERIQHTGVPSVIGRHSRDTAQQSTAEHSTAKTQHSTARHSTHTNTQTQKHTNTQTHTHRRTVGQNAEQLGIGGSNTQRNATSDERQNLRVPAPRGQKRVELARTLPWRRNSS